MPNRTVGLVLLLLAGGLAGCDSDRGPAPSGPSSVPQPGPQPPPPRTVQLAGTVSDAAWRPLAGARVEVVDGPHAGLATTTDAIGGYRLSGTFDDTTHFRATKDGHVPATLPLPAVCDVCNPKWWIHFSLEAQTPPARIAGDYTLIFVADSACTGLPDEARTRSYQATVTASSRPGDPANSRFDVTLTGGTFVEHYNSVTIGVVGEYIKTDIGDWGHGGPGLVEQIAPHTYLTLGGEIATSVIDPTTIAGAFVGTFERCELPSEWGSRYRCDGASVSHARCFSKSHSFSLRRR